MTSNNEVIKKLDEMEENTRIQLLEYIKKQNTNNQWVTTDIGER